MYGNHSFDEAKKIADAKTAETGVTHAVVPCGDEAPGMFTIGREIKALSGEEFKQRLLSKHGAQRGKG